MAHQEPTRKHSGGPHPACEIPDKLYFRIGEVAKLCDVPAYVLRFWESEFPQLKPNKGGSGQRLYRRRDVEMALRIKNLLYQEGYTIAGARQAFKSELRSAREVQLGLDGISRTPGMVEASHLEALQRDLRDLYTQLSRPIARGPAPSGQTVQLIRPARPKLASRPAPTPWPRLVDNIRPVRHPDSLFDTFPPEN